MTESSQDISLFRNSFTQMKKFISEKIESKDFEKDEELPMVKI